MFPTQHFAAIACLKIQIFGVKIVDHTLSFVQSVWS